MECFFARIIRNYLLAMAFFVSYLTDLIFIITVFYYDNYCTFDYKIFTYGLLPIRSIYRIG